MKSGPSLRTLADQRSPAHTFVWMRRWAHTILTGITLRQYRDLALRVITLRQYRDLALRVITLRAEAVQKLLYEFPWR